MCIALKKDKILYHPKTRFQIAKEIVNLGAEAGSFMFRALLPGFNPRKSPILSGSNIGSKGTPIPLLDTSNPEIPVPF
jgi:hypothetical protein